MMEPSVVMVLDVLGFKALSQSSRTDEFHRLYRVLSRAQRHLRPIIAGAYEFKVYTDNIAVCWPIGSQTDSEVALGMTILQVALFQMDLACAGYCVRGAIAVGDVFADRNTVFGPALIEAHEAERGAKQPRVVLAPSAVSHALVHRRYYAPPRYSPQDTELLFDRRDSCVFVDYLTCWEGNFDDPDLAARRGLPRLLREHREFICTNLGLPHPRKIKAKYRWLAQYHNYAVARRGASQYLVKGTRSQDRFVTLAEFDKHSRRPRHVRSARGK
jgi:hypothetical protein